MFATLGPRQWQAVAQAWDHRSIAELGPALHKLKGSLLVFGARQGAQHASMLEAACELGAAFSLTAAYTGLGQEVTAVAAELERYLELHAQEPSRPSLKGQSPLQGDRPLI